MHRSLIVATFTTLTVFVTFACSSTDDGSSGSSSGSVDACTVKDRTGKSSCSSDGPPVPGAPARAPITCSAGTYCSTVNIEAKCLTGCVSDENCGSTERCVRCGDDDIGSCRACNATNEEVCKAAPAKDAGPTTTEGCKRDTSFDKKCASPGKAYTCDDTTKEPEDAGTCTQVNSTGVFCCGGGVASACTRATQKDLPLCQGDKAFDCPAGEEPEGTCELAPDGMTYCCN